MTSRRSLQRCRREVLILSEFTGAFQSLGAGAVRVNPWNIEETAEAIYVAVEDADEKKFAIKMTN